MIGIFQYRDASNYKFNFEAEIPPFMRVGDETTYETLGYSQDTFFGNGNVVPFPFNEDDDHNIVELVEIKNEEETERARGC